MRIFIFLDIDRELNKVYISKTLVSDMYPSTEAKKHFKTIELGEGESHINLYSLKEE